MGTKQSGEYPSDVTDEEWAFVLPYLLLCRENSPQRKHDLRTVFNAVRYVARTGGQWRYLPNGSAAMVRGVSADAAVAPREVLRDDCARRALAVARVGRTQMPTDGGGDRQSHPAVDAGVRRACW
jgi:transposase